MAAGRILTGEKAAGAPLVSVIVATGPGRPSLSRAIRSVLENRTPRFDVWIADRAPGSLSPDALHPLMDDPRVHVLKMESVPSAAAHNRAIAEAPGEILAVTDDDCEVAPDWIESMVGAFDRDPRIGVVFGNVHPANPDDPSAPAYVRDAEFLARNLGEKCRVEGIWACMGVRRRTWETLGGFDERFGQGTCFPGGADADFAIRALAAGNYVLETPRMSVRSHRSLTPSAHRRAVAGYTYASGAVIGRHLRGRTPGILRLVAGLGGRWIAGETHGALGGPGSRHRGRRLIAFLYGVARGATAPAD